MLPIGPLMIEHRLIERMIDLMRQELSRLETEKEPNLLFIEKVVDFIRMYADRCHHGKEEDILFRDLKAKPVSADHKRIMEELIEDHQKGREITRRLAEANEAYRRGNHKTASAIFECMGKLVNFYPKHIEKEDRHFFIPIMGYFSLEEKNAMLKEEYEFDRKLTHDIFKDAVFQTAELVASAE